MLGMAHHNVLEHPVARETHRHTYSLYGVRITSDRAFEFPSAVDTGSFLADVEFVQTTAHFFDPSDKIEDESAADGWFSQRRLPDGSTYLRCGRLYEFCVEADGKRIVTRPLEGADPLALQNFLFGQVLSFALIAQGLEQLHATVLNVHDLAVGFLGDCRFGKSTLAAAFVQAGHRLVTDDMLMLDDRDGCLFAQPGSGRIKLQPDSAAALLAHGRPSRPLIPGATKHCFSLQAHEVERTTLPLRHVYLLPPPIERESVAEIDIQQLSHAAGFRALLSNSFNVAVLERDRLARQFAFAATVATRVPVHVLRYPPGLSHVQKVRQAVTEHVMESRLSLGGYP